MRANLFASRRGRRVPALLVLGLLLAAAGCKVTAEDIDHWKNTVKGPGKIVAVLLTDRYPLELRTRAALALVEMERDDVSGVGELQRAIEQIHGRDPQTAQAIIDGMVEGLKERMRGGDDANQSDDLGPPPSQTRAKDTAYLLMAYASPEAQRQLMEAILQWYTVDFAERSLAGDYSAEQVVRSLGAPAASYLVDAMNAHQPQQALVKIAQLISQLGNAETKLRAAQRLVEIEREMESDEFIDWLKSQIGESLQEQGRTLSDDRLRAIALHNRETFLNEGALAAMKHLASQEPVRNRLMEIAASAPAADAPDFAKEALNTRRQSALQALEGNATEEQLQALLNIALDETNPINVRDYAFDRVGDIRSRAAIPRLWPLVQSADNNTLKKRLRWRAGELVLAIGGPDIVPEFLTRLPADSGVEYEPEELEGYATKMSTMTPQPTQLIERQLRSPQWFVRVIALRFFERRGTREDIPKLRRLENDRTATVGDGWAGLELPTVGKVAEDAIRGLEERLAGPQAAGQQGGATMQPAQR